MPPVAYFSSTTITWTSGKLHGRVMPLAELDSLAAAEQVAFVESVVGHPETAVSGKAEGVLKWLRDYKKIP